MVQKKSRIQMMFTWAPPGSKVKWWWGQINMRNCCSSRSSGRSNIFCDLLKWRLFGTYWTHRSQWSNGLCSRSDFMDVSIQFLKCVVPWVWLNSGTHYNCCEFNLTKAAALHKQASCKPLNLQFKSFWNSTDRFSVLVSKESFIKTY